MSPRTEGKATLGTKAKALPNELLGQITEYLSPRDALSLGRTCKSLQAIVNDRAKVISAPVIKRERIRLDNDVRMFLKGLTLDEAVRSWTLHHSVVDEEPSFLQTSAEIAMAFMGANKIDLPGFEHAKDRDFYRHLVEYLLHLNVLAHYKAQKSQKEPARHCCWIDLQVRHFEEAGWEKQAFPLVFLDHVSSPTTKSLVTPEQWLGMVRNILTQPLEDTTTTEKAAANKALLSHVRRGLGQRGEQLNLRRVHWKFGDLAGLPFVQGMWKMYVPKMNVAEMRQSLRTPAETLGARAAEEFCRREFGPLAEVEKLLDPKNRLLLAILLSELHVVVGQVPDKEGKRVRLARPRGEIEWGTR